MKTLEDRIAEALQEQAPVHVRTMPKGTRASVRVRQAMSSAVTIAIVVVAAMGAMSVLSAAPRATQPGSEQTVPPPAGFVPGLQGTEGGANDATAAPDNGATATEDTTAHGTNSTQPYTEQVIGQEAYLLTQKHVVAFGHVNGVEWSLAAYDTRAYSGDAFPRFLGGACGDLMVGDQGEYGGISLCLHTAETSPDAQFAMAGFGNRLDPNTGPIIGYAGLVGSRVSSVELRQADGTVTDLPLYDAPSGIGIDARYFETFVEAGTAGRIVALAPDGSVLDAGSLCVAAGSIGSDNIGCGHGLVDVSSVVTTLSPAPTAG
jgi:hypothetical protein